MLSHNAPDRTQPPSQPVCWIKSPVRIGFSCAALARRCLTTHSLKKPISLAEMTTEMFNILVLITVHFLP